MSCEHDRGHDVYMTLSSYFNIVMLVPLKLMDSAEISNL